MFAAFRNVFPNILLDTIPVQLPSNFYNTNTDNSLPTYTAYMTDSMTLSSCVKNLIFNNYKFFYSNNSINTNKLLIIEALINLS